MMLPVEDREYDLDAVYALLVQYDVVEVPDDLYALVAELWPDLLHKVKPPIGRMH